MGGFIRWMSRSFDARPTVNQCIGFAAYTVTPFLSRALPACIRAAGWRSWCSAPRRLYSTFLLFVGLPTFMHERKEQGLLNSACVWGVGLLVLVTILVEMILLWFNVLTPEYLRTTVGATDAPDGAMSFIAWVAVLGAVLLTSGADLVVPALDAGDHLGRVLVAGDGHWPGGIWLAQTGYQKRGIAGWST
jgi:hypothetical protein